MIDTKLLRQKILDLAIRGKLVEQNANDEDASELLKRIRVEKEQLIKDKKIKRDKNESSIFKGDDNRYYEKVGEKTTDITEQIPFEIPNSWQWCRLSTLCNYGFCETEKPDDISEQSWILDLEDIEKDTAKLLVRNKKHAKSINSSKHKFKKGNVLYSKLRTYLNKVLIADMDGYCTSEILPLDFGRFIINIYARHVLMSQMFLAYTKQCDYGVKMPRLGTSDGRKALFPLPPLEEQKRIVTKIEELMSLVNEIDRNNADLEKAMKLAKDKVLDLAIRGKLVSQNPNDEPASELLKRIKTEKEALIKAGKIKRDKNESTIFKGDDNCYYEVVEKNNTDITDKIPFDIPPNWEWVKLGNLIKLVSGQDLTPDKYNAKRCGIPYITGASNIEDNHVIINRWTEYPRAKSFSGDLLLTCKGTVGIMAFLQEKEVHIARQIMAISVLNQSEIKYIRIFLESFISELKSSAKSMIPGIARDDVLRLLIPFPPLGEQKRIVAKVEELFSNIETMQ